MVLAVIAGTVISLASHPLGAQAQSPQPSQSPQSAQPVRPQAPSAWGKQARPAGANQEYRADKLTEPLAIPNLPVYPGKAKFLNGLRYPSPHSGARFGMTYGLVEEPSAVFDWYRDSLKSYKWHVVPSTTEQNVLVADMAGNSLSVRVSPSRSRGYRSELVVTYKFAR
jgi:hypothetical protein